MKPNPSRRDEDEGKAALDAIVDTIFRQAKAQFGSAVKSSWLYNGDLCPGCTKNPIGAIKYKGKDAVAINAFIYRERGVLIGYFLCETCAKHIFKEAKKNPYHQTPLHTDIERNLIAAYHEHLASLN
jgi:hypothetical protein